MSKTADILRIVAAAVGQMAEVFQADESPKSVPEVLAQAPAAVKEPPSCEYPEANEVPAAPPPVKTKARKPTVKQASEISLAEPVNREEVRQRLVTFIRTQSREAAASLLKGVGFGKLSDVPDDRLNDVVKALEAQNG